MAFIVGGGGQIGRAAARRLLADGWRVRLAQRSHFELPADIAGEIERANLDRNEEGALARALGDGADALIDCVAFDEPHGRQLLELQDRLGAMVVISTGSVYCDDRGRTLDEAAENGFPDYPVPIREDQPTVPPGPATYSTRKAALERTLLDGARTPVVILRPFAIHGEGSAHAREWWFVKRFLDGRGRIPLAWRGESRFQTTAAVNIAELIVAALRAPAPCVLNSVDPDAPSVAEIGRSIARLYGANPEFVLIDGPPKGAVGRTPWSGPAPLVASGRAAEAIGYRPAATYADAVVAACRSAAARHAEGKPFLAYIEAMFDYAAEDAFLRAGA